MKQGKILKRELEFESIDDILQYAKKHELQVFTTPAYESTEYIGKYKDIDVYRQTFWGYIDILGLTEEEIKYVESKLGKNREVV
jgi:hypothetical protein